MKIDVSVSVNLSLMNTGERLLLQQNTIRTKICVLKCYSLMKLLRSCIVSYKVILVLSGFILINLTLYNFILTTNSADHYNKRREGIWTHEMKAFCSKVQQRIDDEKKVKLSNLLAQNHVPILSPNVVKYTRRQFKEIFYRYSEWHSSPDLPRRINPCDHQLFTEMLRILDHFFRRHHISYMIMDGTLLGEKKLCRLHNNLFAIVYSKVSANIFIRIYLRKSLEIKFILGSYTHHDFLPWDDDVDLRLSTRDRSRMYKLLHEELGHKIKITNINNKLEDYDILYFYWAPQAGTRNWSYPCIHIVYLHENSTHMWKSDTNKHLINNCAISKQDLFPLIWRPFGEIWLPVSFI